MRQPVIYQRQTKLQTVQRATFYLLALSSKSILNLRKRQNRVLRNINTCYQFATLSIHEQEEKGTAIGPRGEKLAKEMNIRARARSLSCIRLLATPWTVARQVPLSMKFSRQRILEQGCHFFLQGIFQAQKLNSNLLWLLLWQVDSFLTAEPPGKPNEHIY